MATATGTWQDQVHELARERDAVILAHNYQQPAIQEGVADHVGDSLALLHQLAEVNRQTTFLPVNPQAFCRFMEMTTPQVLLRCLREGRDEVTLAPEIAQPARRAVERMVASGRQGGGE